MVAVAWKRHRPEQTFHPSVSTEFAPELMPARYRPNFKKQFDTVCKEIARKHKD